MINTVYAPGSLTNAETFVWYRAHPRLRLGIAELSKQGAFRFLASGTLALESEHSPSVNFSVGVQGIGTGNPGYSSTLEKNFKMGENNLNLYLGIGFRSNENHGHAVGGVRFSMENGFGLGIQDDGHQRSPFLTYSQDQWLVGLYYVGFKNPAYLVGLRF